MTSPRVSFKTVGCRLNRAETAMMAASFEAAGYQVVPFGEPCDVCVVHGCSVTQHAERTTARFSRLAKNAHHSPFVIVAGCAAEVAGDGLRISSRADLLAGQADKLRLPVLLGAEVRARAPNAVARATAPLVPRFDTIRAWVKVQDGCSFGCAYCIVPLARGPARSRGLAEILDEVRMIGDAGYREVVLSGANLGVFSPNEGGGLLDLLEKIEAVPAIQRVRLSSIEITTAERAVIDFMAGSAKLCHFLHVPLQSGDDRILAAMGRRYTRRQYRETIEYAAGRVAGIGLGTDILVGFPGEDEAAFQATFDLVEQLPISNLHIFPYSRREGTRAAAMSGQIPAPEKKARVQRLSELKARKREDFARSFIGKPVSVLIEEVKDGSATGWTGEYVEACLTGAGLKSNEIRTFTPSRVEGAVLQGDVVPIL